MDKPDPRYVTTVELARLLEEATRERDAARKERDAARAEVRTLVRQARTMNRSTYTVQAQDLARLLSVFGERLPEGK